MDESAVQVGHRSEPRQLPDKVARTRREGAAGGVLDQVVSCGDEGPVAIRMNGAGLAAVGVPGQGWERAPELPPRYELGWAHLLGCLGSLVAGRLVDRRFPPKDRA